MSGKRSIERGTRRLQLGDLRQLVQENKVELSYGIVKPLPGETDHFRYDEDEVIVAVELQPSLVHLEARLGCLGGVAGVWIVPDDGDEVMVGIPDDDHAGAFILNLFGNAPAGMVPRRVYVRGVEVLVFNEDTGETEPVVRKSEFDVHKHPTGTGPSGVPDNAPITGTEVFKAA